MNMIKTPEQIIRAAREWFNGYPQRWVQKHYYVYQDKPDINSELFDYESEPKGACLMGAILLQINGKPYTETVGVTYDLELACSKILAKHIPMGDQLSPRRAMIDYNDNQCPTFEDAMRPLDLAIAEFDTGLR